LERQEKQKPAVAAQGYCLLLFISVDNKAKTTMFKAKVKTEDSAFVSTDYFVNDIHEQKKT